MIRKFIAVGLLLFSAGIAAAGVLPGISDTVVVRDWLLCGPFPVGAREGITGVIDDPMTFRPVEGETLRSGLPQGGFVVWHAIEADSLGWIETDYDSVRWDSLMDYYGIAGLACAGYACAEVECSTACRALAITHRAGFMLNGLGYRGDSYGRGWLRTPVKLDSGVNRVLLPISGYADRRVRFMLEPVRFPVMTLCRDATTPDAIADSSTTVWLGIPVLNTTDSRLDSVTLTISLDSVLAETTVSNLPALGAKKVPVRLTIPARPSDSSGLPLVVTVRIPGPDSRSVIPSPSVIPSEVEESPPGNEQETPGETLEGRPLDSLRSLGVTWCDTIKLRIRTADESHKRTFISAIDNSCQYYGILYPTEYDPEKRYGLILSLHGASVEASGLVNCYKPKDWAFVVCPTNRRPFGFDWQDWGRLDAIEVLDTVLAELPIDPDRVVLTGHSMGGHGTWHVGLAHADRFAAAGVGAGWPSFQLYVPWFLQRTKTFAEPAQQAIRDMVLAPDNTPAFLPNALNLPYFILHGGDDDNVPTIHGRNFAAWLDELDYEYVYKEVPDRKHWWTYDDGISVADDTDMMAFFKSHRRDPGPRHIRFRTADLGQSNRSYWLTIDQVRTVGRMAEVEAWAEDSVIRIKTRNISRFSIDLDERLFFAGRVLLEIDGRKVGKPIIPPARVTVHDSRGTWKTGKPKLPALHKKAKLYGPAKQVMFSPFVIAYGTADTGLTRFLRHAATQEAMRWWLRGNGLAEVLPDSEVTPAIAGRYNLILYGGPDQNSCTREIAGRLPIQVRKGRMFLGSRDLGDSLAALFTYPSPHNPENLVLVRMGTDAKHTRLSLFWGFTHSGAGVPDFMVFDRTVKHQAWAGVRAAGFFGPDWKLDPASMYLQE